MMAEPGSLGDKVALVTGGSKGIGLATAKALAQAGAKVVITGRDETSLLRAGDAISAETHQPGVSSGRITAIPLDVRDDDACQRTVASIERLFGRLDLCVCAAGIGHWGEVSDLSPEAWRETLTTNVDGVFYTARAALGPMLRQGSGHIVTLASIYAHKGSSGFSAYCASKYAVLGFSASLALEVRPQGIKVTVISPGTVDTGFRDHMTNRPRTGLLAHPERMLTADDVASAILWAATTSPTAVPDEVLLDTAQWW